VLERRFPLVALLLSPATVQGASAPASIVKALSLLIEYGACDVIIVGRGGGSADDLAAFNDESVVRAIFGSPVPVISAVGHETDWSLADLVADLRAPTPSAAAELASPSTIDLLDDIADAQDRLLTTMGRTMEVYRHQLAAMTRRLSQRSPALQIERIRSELVMMGGALSRAMGSRLSSLRTERADLSQRATEQWREGLRSRSWGVELRATALGSLNPEAVLSRGFALVESERTGSVLRSIHDTAPGDVARISMTDGYLLSEIREQVPARVDPESSTS
jgi:exodeoxyribonuclease VII large subunit